MTSHLARLREALKRFLPSGRRRNPPPDRDACPHPYPSPYSCVYVGGPTARQIGSRPSRGEDSPLVRPYLLADERRTVARRALRIVGPSADIRTLPALPVGAAS